MAADKQSNDHRAAARALASVKAVRDLLQDEAPTVESNYHEMVRRVVTTGRRSKPCGSCRGRCFRTVSQATLDRYEKKISKATSPTRREQLREELRDLSLCRTCNGSGLSPATSTATLCDACKASGRNRDGSTCKACRGQRVVRLGEYDDFFTTAECSRCRGCGEVLDDELQDVCPLCSGASCTVPATVKEKAGAGGGGLGGSGEDYQGGSAAGRTIAHDVNDPAHEYRSQVRIREADSEALQVLRIFHGAVGDKWGASRWLRIFALWPYTMAGKQILEEARRQSLRTELKGAGYLKDEHEFLSELRAAEMASERPNFPLRVRFSEADDQARRILSAANDETQAAS